MSTLILPRSIRGTDSADNATADRRHEDAAYEATALAEGIDRTVKWAHSDLAGYRAGDGIIAVRHPGRERVIHTRPDGSAQSGMKLRVYDCHTPRPCPGCGKNLYGIGEVQGEFAPWHLACWEMEQAMRELPIPIDFDHEGLPVVSEKGRGRPRRRRR